MQGTKPARFEKRLRIKAIKVHYCYLCGKVIPSGERYVVLGFIKGHSIELKFYEDCYKALKADPVVLEDKQIIDCMIAETLYERQAA